MKLLSKIVLAALLVLVLPAVLARAEMNKGQREDPIVADGLTIADHLVADSNNNIDDSHLLTNAITVVAGSSTVTITQTSHGLSVSNPVSFYSSTVVGGLSIDGGWTVATVPTADTFTITHTARANATTGPTGSTIITNPSSFQTDGKLRFICKFSHLSYDDPILFYGIPGATHLHIFFGNDATNYNSTYASLRSSGGGTCQGGPLNRTGYWMPAMIDTSLNKVRIPIDFQWYYVMDRANLAERTSPDCVSRGGSGLLQDGRTMACPQYPMKKLERGMRAVMGFKVSSGDYPDTYVGPYRNILANSYSCLDTGGNPIAGEYRYLYHRTTAALGLSSNVLCPTDGQVQIRVSSPACWNGSHTGTNDFDQLATVGLDNNSNTICPATHPNPFMGFAVIARYSYTGGISQLANWYLSSDRFNGANFEAGESFHWDMFWAWNDAIQMHFHRNLHGMFPDPASSLAAGGPYINSWLGNAEAARNNVVGGPFMRNTTTGGLSGNAGIGDCTALGLVGKCSLDPESGLSDILIDIPTPPLGHYP